MVRLKNSNGTLPLGKAVDIAVFGNDAPDVTQSLAGATNASIGTLIVGGGSGTARVSYIISSLYAPLARTRQDGTRVQYTTDSQAVAGGILAASIRSLKCVSCLSIPMQMKATIGL